MDYQAKQADQAAEQERAAAQRRAAEQRRQAKILESDATAAAGASGGGVADPTIKSIIGAIDAEGGYRSASALYEGEDAARGLEQQADLRRYEGRAAKQAGNMAANSTLFKGAADTFMTGVSFYEKFNARRKAKI